MNKTVLIVGLGNVGKEYVGTRHNIGFTCIDTFTNSHDFDPWTDKKDLKCLLASKVLGDTRVLATKPTTFMNLSGEAVQKVVHFYKIPLQSIIVVHDELDVPFGAIRSRVGGGSAGNNGIKSLIQHLGPDFSRIRVGIDSPAKGKMDSADFVLAKFSKDEQAHVPALAKEVTSILTEFIFGGELPHDTRQVIDSAQK